MSKQNFMLKQIENFIRVDEEDEEIINGFIDAAKEYIQNSGVKENENSALYRLAVCIITAHFYENRTVTDDIPKGAKIIINQLYYRE